MNIDELLLVSEKDLMDKYTCKENPRRYYKSLLDDDVLPLKGSFLISPKGIALVKFMTWVWLSGSIHCKKYTPSVSDDDKYLLKYLKDRDFGPLEKKFQIRKGTLTLSESGGAYGRLISAAGVLPGNGLPLYAKQIMKCDSSNHRDYLLEVMTRIIFKDRLKAGLDYRPNYLFLNRFSEKDNALNHGLEILDFLNARGNVYSPDQVKAYKDGDKYKCMLVLKNEIKLC